MFILFTCFISDVEWREREASAAPMNTPRIRLKLTSTWTGQTFINTHARIFLRFWKCFQRLLQKTPTETDKNQTIFLKWKTTIFFKAFKKSCMDLVQKITAQLKIAAEENYSKLVQNRRLRLRLCWMHAKFTQQICCVTQLRNIYCKKKSKSVKWNLYKKCCLTFNHFRLSKLSENVGVCLQEGLINI